MIDLVSRLKVTRATTCAPAPAPKEVAKAPSAVKIPAPTVAKVAPIVPDASAGHKICYSKSRDEALINAAVAHKLAEATHCDERQFNETILASLRTEYQQWLIDNADLFNDAEPLFFTPKPLGVGGEIDNDPVPKSAPIPMVNGISVGEEAGDTLVVTAPTPKKKSSRKKKTEEAPVAEAPAEETVAASEPTIVETTEEAAVSDPLGTLLGEPSET